jgi:hypothetical protein
MQSGRGAQPENEGKDMGKKQIQEEVGCRLQKGVPPCKSGMAKKEPLQECPDPKKLWTVKETDRHRHKDDPKGWTFGKRRWVNPEGSTGVKVPNTRQHRRLKNEKMAGQIFEKTFRLQIAKREDRSSVGSLKIRNWTLWGGRSPPKRKKKTKRQSGSQ